MKYVRTKDGVYRCYRGEQHYLKLDSAERCVGFIKDFDPIIIKQADTIEDLCDVYVIVVEINEQKQKFVRPLYDVDEYNAFNFDEAKIMRSYIIKMLIDNFGSDGIKTDLLYGAIWTDEGLRYVAKTDGQGELELL